jgi:amino acid permease
MKSFNQWLNAITIMIVVIIMVDVNLAWLGHPQNKNPFMQNVIIVCSLILVALIIWNIYSKQKRRKK